MKFLRIDLYILKRVALPLAATVGIAMAALLLERLIRLLDLFANRGGPMNIVLKMLANLVPHYLGLALPATMLMLFINLVLGFASRVAPQLSLFSIGFPVTLLAGLMALALGTEQLAGPLDEALRVFLAPLR